MRGKHGLAILVLTCLPVSALAATHDVPCSGDITYAVEAALSAAADGDTILLGSGTCTIQNVMVAHGVSILGESRTGTVITGAGTMLFEFSGDGTGKWEFGNLTVTGDNGQDIAIEGGFESFRIHDMDIRSSSERFAQIGFQTIGHMLYRGGPVYRNKMLFDNILLEASTKVQFVKIWGNNHVAWGEPDGFGTDNFVFIEDCGFIYSGTTGTITDTEGGGRFVFRHNKVTNGQVSMHCTGSTQGMRGNRAVEIYANTFVCSNATGGGACNNRYAFEATRGGTGLFYDNDISGDYFTSAWPMQGRIAWEPGTGFLDWGFDTTCGTSGTRKMCLDAQVRCTEGNRGPTARPHDYGGSTWGDNICAERGEGQAGPDWSCTNDDDCNDLDGSPGKCVQIDGLGRTGSEVEGWPCRDQFGRGQDDQTTGEQAAAPIYWWNNTWQGEPQVDIPPNQYSDFFQKDRDWCAHDPSTDCGEKAAWTYEPFPYPHPLRTDGGEPGDDAGVDKGCDCRMDRYGVGSARVLALLLALTLAFTLVSRIRRSSVGTGAACKRRVRHNARHDARHNAR